MKYTTLTVLALLLFSAVSFGQRYSGGDNALGARIGGGTGITFKHFNSPVSAFEFVGGWGFYDDEHKGTFISALYEKHAPLSGNKLAALVGGGPSVLFGDNTAWGISGIIGFDWRLGKTPLNLQLDWMPSWYFINDGYLNATNGALSVRYILNHRSLYGKDKR